MIIGFNYHPTSVGCQYWHKWNPEEIKKDFEYMHREGFNTVRFFIFWNDFEPEEGVYKEVMFDRLESLVQMAEENSLKCIPSILTIWMNGQLFDLNWRKGRSLWSNSLMLNREEEFIKKVVDRLKNYNNIYAYDIGDEMHYIDKSEVETLSKSDVNYWLTRLINAVREVDSKVKIMKGSDLFTLIGQHNYNTEEISKYCDLSAIHGFPLWTPFHIESNDSFKASLYVPFLVKLVSAFGPPFVDEFGLYGSSEEIRAKYINSSGVSTILNGSNGIIAWCWKDFSSTDKPYKQNPGEKFVGFYDTYLNGKNSALAFKNLGELMSKITLSKPSKAKVGIFVSEMYFEGEPNLQNKNNSTNAAALFYSFLLFKRSHITIDFVRSNLEDYKAIILPCIRHLTQEDMDKVERFVKNGGIVIYSPGSYLNGFGGENLFGIELYDYSLDTKGYSNFEYKNINYKIDWSSSGLGQIPIIKEKKAEVLSRYPTGDPVITLNRLGKGRAYYINAPIELSLNAPYKIEKENFRYLYKDILEENLFLHNYSFSEPEVEIHHRETIDNNVFYLINHSNNAINGILRINDDEKEINLNAKETLRLNERGEKVESYYMEQSAGY